MLFFVDADVAVRPDAVAHIARALEDRGVAAVIGSYDATPGATNFSLHKEPCASVPAPDCAHGRLHVLGRGCGAIRTSAFHAVSGFDERYGPQIEDIELGYWLRRAGMRIRVDLTF